jgi:ribosomal protein S27AE
VLDNLREIRERGVAEFVEQEKVRWRCPQCGNILSMHRDRCLHCGRTW